MKLVPMKELLTDAYEKGYAVPALNGSHLEFYKGFLEVAAELKSPLIIQAAYEEVEYVKSKAIVEMIKVIGEDKDIKVAIHLDHGPSFDAATDCLRGGFTSVMFDGSRLPFEENIAVTKKVVEMAHAVGVTVEGELGTIGQTTEFGDKIDNAHLTDPNLAKEFVEKTGIDCLAAAFGTAHGLYDGEPKLDFELLKQISELTNIPIVMHGGTGVPEYAVKKAISLGVSKINVSTALRKAFIDGMKMYMEENPTNLMTMDILGAGTESLKEEARKVIKTFGSENRL